MRRTVTHTIHRWGEKDALVRVEGDLIYPGTYTKDWRERNPHIAPTEARQREALGLIPEHGVGDSLLNAVVDPRWVLLLRQVMGIAMAHGVTTHRQLLGCLYLTYCSIAGARWIRGRAIGDYVGVDTKRLGDLFEPWGHSGIRRRRSPGDERRVEYRLAVPRAKGAVLVIDHAWYMDEVFSVPEDFTPHKIFGLPSLDRADLALAPSLVL